MAMASVSSHHCCASTTLSFCPRSGTTAVSFSSPSSSCPSSSASSSSSSLRLRSLLPGKRICESHTNASYPKSALVSPDVEKLLSSSSRRSERLSGARSHLTRPRRCAVFCNASQTTTPNGAVDFRRRSPKEINVLIVGATGYIGKFVVREVVKRGYNVIAVAREKSGIGGKSGVEQTQNELAGAQVCFADVTNLSSLQDALRAAGTNIDVVISCLASRRGGVKDSWVVDYGATKNSLVAGRELGASHFVLLSAICVQKPLLEFQRAKLKFEEELQSESNDSFTYSVVRPTAFFKSLGGQVKSVQGGGPYVMFGDGALNACKPISEADLARFVADSITDEDKVNKVLPIGGPGKALTPLEQGSILFRVLGKEPKFIKVPIQIMDFVISQLDFWKRFFPKLEDVAEFGKIGRYYAAESMLVLNPETGNYDADATPSYGTDTLEAFFENVAKYGMAGQELGDQAVF